MNKKLLFYILSILIILVLVIQLKKCKEKINILEDQINEYKSSKTENYHGNYQGNDDFSEIIDNNPIDKDYRVEFNKYQRNSEVTTLGWGALQAKYTTKWQEEVNSSLEYLYKFLSEQDSSNLKQSQKSWQIFMDDDFNFVDNRFINTGYFGTQGMVRIATVKLHRTRDRAIELMEYIFILDRNAVDFVYDN